MHGLTTTEYLQRIRKVVDALAGIGHLLSLDEHITVITDGISEEYAMYISSIMTRSSVISLIEVEGLFLVHEDMYERFDQAFQVNSGLSATSQSSSTLPPPFTFHNPRAYLATPASLSDFAWFPNTGASHHVTADSSNFLTISEYNGPNQILLDKWFSQNFVSVQKFAVDNDVYFDFHVNVCYVKSQGTHKIMLNEAPRHGVYEFENIVVTKNNQSAPISASNFSKAFVAKYSDWTSDFDDRRSTCGYCVHMVPI
ncbi:uncharacterized protein [Arachis hypogaea]|uniref:uncharacterized protein n=1 Tax=Arachis hypogaea TaxID=3818 RepID=UPI003B219236